MKIRQPSVSENGLISEVRRTINDYGLWRRDGLFKNWIFVQFLIRPLLDADNCPKSNKNYVLIQLSNIIMLHTATRLITKDI